MGVVVGDVDVVVGAGVVVVIGVGCATVVVVLVTVVVVGVGAVVVVGHMRSFTQLPAYEAAQHKVGSNRSGDEQSRKFV